MHVGVDMTQKTKAFSGLLEEQYAVIEEYANAQTFLFNVITTTTRKTGEQEVPSDDLSSFGDTTDSSTIKALERLDEARTNVRSNFKSLREDACIKERHSVHIDLSRRVIETISNNPSWHANGLPTPTAGNNGGGMEGLKTNTVAIAALKASIARIREIEGTV